ncbi:hypothetical protein [Vibrio sp. EA2]|uniref:hypothetical protein n=1 Tax=Vibrio sp. EA2 TaxID=3079860 RepID=UPI002949C98D|nr:hypothetical protein [Vibrio sp. EA2]MDV6251080.1 hypothetical protein [Vibrio sp. EA2]
MNLSIWKSKRNKSLFVASLDNGTHIYFDAFELEPVEASLWLYQGTTLVSCIRATSANMPKVTNYARRMLTMGAQNYGEPLSQIEVVA